MTLFHEENASLSKLICECVIAVHTCGATGHLLHFYTKFFEIVLIILILAYYLNMDIPFIIELKKKEKNEHLKITKNSTSCFSLVSTLIMLTLLVAPSSDIDLSDYQKLFFFLRLQTCLCLL